MRPRAVDQALDFLVERGKSLGLFTLEAFGGVGVDRAEPKHGGQHVGAGAERRASRRGDVEVAAGVDHDVAEQGLAPALRIADHAIDLSVFDESVRKPGVQAQVDFVPGHQFERDALPAIGVESHRETNGVRLVVAVEIESAPARPAAHCRGAAAPFVLGRKTCQPECGEALDHVQANAPDRNLVEVAVPHVVKHQHHAARGQAPEVVVAFYQQR